MCGNSARPAESERVEGAALPRSAAKKGLASLWRHVGKVPVIGTFQTCRHRLKAAKRETLPTGRRLREKHLTQFQEQSAEANPEAQSFPAPQADPQPDLFLVLLPHRGLQVFQ